MVESSDDKRLCSMRSGSIEKIAIVIDFSQPCHFSDVVFSGFSVSPIGLFIVSRAVERTFISMVFLIDIFSSFIFCNPNIDKRICEFRMRRRTRIEIFHRFEMNILLTEALRNRNTIEFHVPKDGGCRCVFDINALAPQPFIHLFSIYSWNTIY